jgi:hypothetical protein
VPRFKGVILVIMGVACATVACDAFMSLDIMVRDRSGAGLSDATVRIAIAKDGRELSRDLTSGHRPIEIGSSYGFRSGRRVLTVDKEHYKRFSATLDPRSAYTCEILLRSEADAELSSGTCVAR